ncbi:Glutaminase 1 [Aquicella siphonis]|uniref:Glutaminase n=1 Tax=Aquicella siphonis TaxID=254247 RepID=A0A5E4PL75_9COXI|nr:glutaminase A [Aquicella siphonis]VVC77171.1 Glutaminase 1 [Aquicella siphonis]
MIKKHNVLFFALLIVLISTNGFANWISNPRDIKQALNDVYREYKDKKGGKNADYIPELAKVDPTLFGIAIVTVNGDIQSIGDADVPFAIESISKPFIYALALHDNGEKIVTEKVGLNATGHSFNSVMAIEEKQDHLQNPLVNAGAIQITSLIKGKTSHEKWQRALDFIKKLSDGNPYLGKSVYQSEMATNQHNRGIAELLDSYGMMASDPLDAVDRYTKACSIMITARQLALMGATLANQGVNPQTHQRVISSKEVQDVLSEMVINGLYENSGIWFWTVGIPAKSGVGGGILAVVPGKMAIAVFSPPLDKAGNSVRAQQVIKEISQRWNLHLLGNKNMNRI